MEWREVPGYPLASKSLAMLYLKSVVNSFIGIPTIGNGFDQPFKGDIEIFINDDGIIVR
jgi:hypothetical protein